MRPEQKAAREIMDNDGCCKEHKCASVPLCTAEVSDIIRRANAAHYGPMLRRIRALGTLDEIDAELAALEGE